MMGLKKITTTFVTLFLFCWSVSGMYANAKTAGNINGAKHSVIVRADQQQQMLLTDMAVELLDDDLSEKSLPDCWNWIVCYDFSKLLNDNFPQSPLLLGFYNIKSKPSTSEPSFLMNFRI